MRSIKVDNTEYKSFDEAASKLRIGSEMIISGDWTHETNPLKIGASKVKIIGVNNAKLRFAKISGSEVAFRDFEITGSPNGFDGLFITGSHCTIKNLQIHDTGLSGLRLYNCESNTIENVSSWNNIHGIAGNSDGINASGGGHHIFTNCQAYGNNDDGFDMWTSQNNLLQGCKAHHNQGLGDGNGFKLGKGGLNKTMNCTAEYNKSDGFDSNGAGNHIGNCISSFNGAAGYQDFRIAGNTQKSLYVNCTGEGNKKGLFKVTSPDLVTIIEAEIPQVDPPAVPAVMFRGTFEIDALGNITGKIL